jgi:2-methylisocitrate lyase-like PEP mutase family enzyme
MNLDRSSAQNNDLGDSFMNKAQRLRQAIASKDITIMQAVFDGFSARLVEHMGYDIAFVTGSGVSESRIGQPDVGLMGLEENVAAVRALAACTDLALLADADTGYGNAVNAYFTQRAMEAAGAAGMMIEDQVWPKRCGHMRGKQVIDAHEMAEKLRAACEARTNPDFVIKARTDTLAVNGIDDTIRRLNLYAEAGADLLFADALMTREQIDLVCRNISKPLCVNMGFGIRKRSTTPLISARELHELGVSVVIYPRMLTACALMGMKKGLEILHGSIERGEVVEREDALVSFEELNAIMGMADIEKLERQFISADELSRRYGGQDASILPATNKTVSN